MVGTAAVARATPDGYTLLMATASLPASKALVKNLEVDAERDLAPISQIGIVPTAISVSSELPVSNMLEFIAYAKSRPGKLNYGTVGPSNTLSIEMFNGLAGINLVRIPYKGDAPTAIALSRNEVQLAFLAPLTAKTLVQNGKARILAVSSATIRSRVIPEVPAAAEAGLKGFDQSAWYGVLAPANTPKNLRDKVAKDISAFVAQPTVQERLGQQGIEPVGNSPDEFARLIADQSAKFVLAARKAGIEPE